MAIGILGRKLGMTRIFNSDGTAVPCTVVAAGPCPVIQVKNAESDGYTAVQIGFDQIKDQKATKPQRGHHAKAAKGCFRHLKEFRVDTLEGLELGGEVTVDIFKPGDKVKVTGNSKGKGFQGVMKRWNFAGMPRSHGHEKVHRSSGSVGHNTFPGKIFKGKKMAGQMGNKRVTSTNLEVVDVRPEENLLVIRGAIPGPRNGLVMINKH